MHKTNKLNFSSLHIPKNATLIKTPIALNWLDENGFVCSISNDSIPTIENFRLHFQMISDLCEGEKRPFLVDPSLAKPLTVLQRKFVDEMINKHLASVAFITQNTMMRMGVNLFFKMRSRNIPMRMFADEASAREWLHEIEGKKKSMNSRSEAYSF